MVKIAETIRVDVDISGLDKVEPKIYRAIVRALNKIGFMVEGDAKILAPKRTGDLARSIHHKQTRFMVSIQDNVNYGIFQELGTSKMAAQPFMRPALEKNLGKIKSIILKEIGRGLRSQTL